jgi:D-3-phosphoglycerate dehydrogenase
MCDVRCAMGPDCTERRIAPSAELEGGGWMSIVISEDLWSEVPDWFAKQHDSVLYHPNLVNNRRALLEAVQDAEVLVVRNKTRVDLELLNAAPKLRAIGRLGVGLDNIDVPAAKAREICVIAARGCNAPSVAEYVMACLLHRSRFLEQSSQHVKQGNWDRSFSSGRELYGKTLGLIGVGDIGARVASRAKAFGMEVIAFDPFVLPTSVLVQDVGVTLHDLDTVLVDAHFISIHVPLTPQTKYLVAKRELTLMRLDGAVINTARGGVLNESDLNEVLAERQQMSAYLDVREQEPPVQPDILGGRSNVIGTPHVAGITRESSQRVVNFVFEQVEKLLTGQTVHGVV